MSGRSQKLRKPTRPKYKVGEWVVWLAGTYRNPCQIIEYVGTVGFDQIHYYRLRQPIWYAPDQEFDFPETSLEPATDDDLARRYPPDQQPPA